MLRLLHATLCLVVLLSVAHPAWGADDQNKGADQGRIDSLLYRLEIPGTPPDKIQALTELCILYLRSQPGESIRYGEQALELGRQHRIDPHPDLLRYLANACERQGNFDKALEYIQGAIQNIDPPDSVDYFRAVDYLAYLYMKKGDYFLSIEQYGKNLALAEKNQMTYAIARTHAGLANVYRLLDENGKEAFHLNKFIEYAEYDKLKRDISIVEFRLGDHMLDDVEYGISLEHYKRALVIARELNDSSWMVSVLNRIGWNYHVMDNPDSALVYYMRSLELALALDFKSGLANTYGNIGTIYRDRKAYDQALSYYNKSLEVAHQASDYFDLAWISNDISEMHAMQGDYKQAYAAHQQYMIYEDSLRDQRYEERMLEIRSRYETEKARNELELLGLRLKNSRYFTYGLTGAIVGILALAILLIRQTRFRTKQRLEAMDHTISEITQQNLRQQMNPHFIFNTLNSIQYYVFQNDKIASNNYLSKFAHLMRKTLDNSQYTAITIKEELEALELYFELETLRFKEKFEWRIIIDEEIDALLYKIPTMLIQPYVENAIVHGLMYMENGKGQILVELALENEHIRCTIDDNGIGREKALEIKRSKNKDHQSLGTSITETRLKLINSIYGKRMNIQYTDKKDETGNPVGTRVVISIPIIT